MKPGKALLSMTIALVLLAAPLVSTALEDRYFDSGGVQIRYVEQGNGESIVLIHGFTAFVEKMWIQRGNNFGKLAETYRVIAFDCRGYGKSGKPYDPRSTGPRWVGTWSGY